MTEKSFDHLLHVEPKRDAYGFAVRPQHLHRFTEYANIYKEEEEERSDKWSEFFEQPSEEHSEILHVQATGQKKEAVSEKALEVDDSRDQKSISDDSRDPESVSDDSTQCDPQKEVPVLKGIETCKVQTCAQVKPTLAAIENLMSFRVKRRKNMKDGQVTISQKHLSLIEEARQPEEESEDMFEEESCVNEILDNSMSLSASESDDGDEVSLEPSFPWKEELESLVCGGVPKALRGEVWQAFVGARTRRVEGYYQDMLASEANAHDSKEHDNSYGVPMKWKRQIEKDLPRTFPGHPALNEYGRDSLRRVLLAYARHNPCVGYCQAMNFFAGLLLLMMPEENAFWTLVGIIDDYFDGYYSEEMIESQVDQLVFEDLMREIFPKLVNHLDYLGVQVAWISAPWFLSIFVNMLPWESVLRVWDVLLFEGNRVMLFRTALALMELYGPALVTTNDAGDAISLLQSLAGSTFDSSQLVLTACMGFLAITEARLQELRNKHRPSVLRVVEERSKGSHVLKDSKGLASKLCSFKRPPGSLIENTNTAQNFGDKLQDGDISPLESCSNNLDEFLSSLAANPEVDSVPDFHEQVDGMKVELCRLLEEKRSATLRAEELETALMEMVKQDNRRQLSARVEQLEQEVTELRQVLADKKEQETAMLQVLMRVEQEQRVTEDARRCAEHDAAAQRYAVHILQFNETSESDAWKAASLPAPTSDQDLGADNHEKYENAMASVAQMEKRVVMAESMLEATLQYESGQVKAQSSPGSVRQGSAQETRKIGLLSRPFGLGWRDRNKEKPTNIEAANEIKPTNEGMDPSTSQ